ncbi:MAG: disulfide bond formation protein B [Acidimicrobiales bacterium]
MDTAAMSLFFALLALAALAGGALSVAVAVSSRGALARVGADLGPNALWAAWLVAAVSTAGSLYYSEVAHFVPCRLCWYQRIAMYPLALVLALAALRRDRGVAPYGIALAAAGLAVSTYHYQLELFPNQSHAACSLDADCSVRLVEEFGFVSIPFMAGCGFLAVLGLLLASARRPAPAPPAAPPLPLEVTRRDQREPAAR